MNDFFKTKRTIGFFILCTIFLVIILVAYFKLAMKPVSPAPQNAPVIERGSIVDRLGRPLAVQTNFYRIGVTTKDIKDKEKFSAEMAEVLGMTSEELFARIDKRKDFVTLKKKVSQDEYQEILIKATEEGFNYFMTYDKIPGRLYPNYAMASQLIGYMGDEGHGLAGIEYSQEGMLYPEIDEKLEIPEQGKNVYLTIDTNLQYKLEQISYKAMMETQAESLMLIAADCSSGEILSYISLPSADLNEYGAASQEARMNRPSTYAYEPGSVFKIFTVGLAYENGGLTASEKFVCDGVYEHRLKSGETIRIKCLEHHGTITAEEALKYSCNDVLGQISDKLSDDDFIGGIRRLGFGQKTGIELAGETTGFVKDTDSKTWSARSKPTIAIGQEISVSALQMVQAATAYANGGVPVKLSVINKITNKDGTILYQHEPEYKERVFKKSTADFILSCMETTATTGTGARANIRDVPIGVKTGTAQMADKVNGGYSDTDFLSNCIAIFPIDQPQIILYIVVEKAKGETYAGRIVAPVIAEAADVIIDHLGMSRKGASSLEHTGVINIPSIRTITLGTEVPDFTGLSKKELLPLIEENKVQLNLKGNGWVTSQSPEPGTPITENMVIELNLE